MNRLFKKLPTLNQKAFTLIELLVVIAIIGLLASVVLASLQTAREKANRGVFLQDVKQIKTALELYHQDNNEYPPNVDPWGTHIGDLMDIHLINYIPPMDKYDYSSGNEYFSFNYRFGELGRKIGIKMLSANGNTGSYDTYPILYWNIGDFIEQYPFLVDYSCGSIPFKDLDYVLFINPVIGQDIPDYFVPLYDDNGVMYESQSTNRYCI